MMKNTIIVVGASAGGVEALRELVSMLPQGFDGAMFIVLHMPSYADSYLAEILNKCNDALDVVTASDGEKILPRKIYVSSPDHHLLIEGDKVLVRKGPKENRFRPSIDALFRSAAYCHGSKVIAIILSGTLNDGTSGMWTVKRLGGITMIQTPGEATFPEMPLSVQEYVDVDHVVPIAEMGNIIELCAKRTRPKTDPFPKTKKEILAMEITIAKKGHGFDLGIMAQGELTPFTCPECHGALIRLVEGKIIRFRCHTGHAFTASALLAGITESIEGSLWNSMRAMEECIMLLDNLTLNFAKAGNLDASHAFAKAGTEHRKRAHGILGYISTQDVMDGEPYKEGTKK